MATLIATADGNLTGSTTFAAAETGTGALNLVRNTNIGFSSPASVASPAFTITNAKIIDAVLLYVRQSAAGSTGTFKVDLQKGGVSQATVTVNKTDLPDATNASQCPVLFKFTSTATGDGGSTWTIVVTTTGTGNIQVFYYANVAGNFTHALRTTTTQSPVAADDLYICGELTGAATKNTRTVTMDSTAATAYGNGAVNSTSVNGGGVHISNWGTLTYGTSVAVNVTWDSASAHNVTLSGGDLVVTSTVLNNDQGARVISTSGKTTGKYYFEVVYNTNAGNNALGVCATTATYALLVGSNAAGGAVLFSNGFCNYDTNYGGYFFSGVPSGVPIGVAVDLDNRKIWWRNSSSGVWNAGGSDDPATNTGGIPVVAGTIVPVVVFNVSGAVFTANFGATAFAGVVPSGFTAGWSSLAAIAPAPGTNYILRVAGDVIVYQYGTLNMGSSAGPPASTAILEFQPVSADGDFGLRCLDNSVVNITGVPRTAGKLVTQCKLTANVVSNNIINASLGSSGAGFSTNALDASGNSLTAITVTDTTLGGVQHLVFGTLPSVPANTTQTLTVWLARAGGTNNRYVRLALGSTSTITNGFYSDIDLQAGTAGTITATGNGTATSVSMVAVGRGYLIKLTGKISTSVQGAALALMFCSPAPGTTFYTGDATPCFIFDHLATVNVASIPDTTFNVDTDAGWLAGDAVCVASTTRTASECEIYPLNANAGSSSFTSALYPFSANVVSTHSGTVPTQAEIGLITRNVKIRSTSTTLMSYVYCTALSTVTATWAEFYYVGMNSAQKFGITVDGGATTNPKSFTYCSLHDIDLQGLACVTATVTSLNLVFSNNVLWNNYASPFVNLSGPVTNNDWTFDNNLLMRGANIGFNLNDLGGVFTNNTVTGVTSTGIVWNEAGATVLGTFDNNTTHSCGLIGVNVTAANPIGVVNNFKAWRNGGVGVQINPTSSVADLVFTNLNLFGNTLTNFRMATGDTVTIKDATIAADTSFSVTNGFDIQPSTAQLNLTSVNMSGIGSIYAPHTTNDFLLAATSNVRGTANNCKFGAPNLFSTAKTTWASSANIGFQKFNQTSGDHRTEMTYGALKTDSSVYNTASPSTRMTPNSASNKLTSATANRGTQVAVASGDTVTASVWIRKDATYFGSQPRLIVRANAAIGINTDTVLATASDTVGLQPATFNGTPSANVVMSNGNLTVTHGSTNSNLGVLSTTALSSGKYYFEITVGLGGNSDTIGVASSGVIGDMGAGVNCTQVRLGSGVSSTIWTNDVNTAIGLGAYTGGTVYCFAIDLTARLAWIRKDSGNWNADGAANPATGVNGVVVETGAFAPAVCFAVNGATNNFTGNFGQTTFAQIVPSGFNSGWGVLNGPGTATWVQLSGTTVAATDDGVMEFIVDCDGTSGFINVDDWSFA